MVNFWSICDQFVVNFWINFNRFSFNFSLNFGSTLVEFRVNFWSVDHQILGKWNPFLVQFRPIFNQFSVNFSLNFGGFLGQICGNLVDIFGWPISNQIQFNYLLNFWWFSGQFLLEFQPIPGQLLIDSNEIKLIGEWIQIIINVKTWQRCESKMESIRNGALNIRRRFGGGGGGGRGRGVVFPLLPDSFIKQRHVRNIHWSNHQSTHLSN